MKLLTMIQAGALALLALYGATAGADSQEACGSTERSAQCSTL